MTLEGQLYPIGYLPTAADNQLGVIKPGNGLDVDGNGVASVNQGELLSGLTEISNLFSNDKLVILREGVAYLISAYTLKQFINFVDLLINWIDVDNTVWDGLTDVNWDNIN
jgi:hypothetical protein